ncbi:MAG: SUMF1/EgtB/PvdO family nonheme iron enzyme [Deltaproteobacteria bacterium]|nr:SUMF1/EgtB/PvdO family nonheme iron enzyme [Deltaproteobacteria bacterium]
MGSNEVDTEAKAMQYGSRKPWFANERPERKLELPDFYMDKTEVTNRMYKEFVVATGRRPPFNWAGGAYRPDMAERPAAFVSWHDADEFCKWKKKRLPTEAEWEKAARGADGRRFPWGNEFDIKKTNTLGEHGGPTPAGFFKDGASPYGALDMAGNVQEWTDDWYKPYPGNDFNDDDYGEKSKVVRGPNRPCLASRAYGGLRSYSPYASSGRPQASVWSGTPTCAGCSRARSSLNLKRESPRPASGRTTGQGSTRSSRLT